MSKGRMLFSLFLLLTLFLAPVEAIAQTAPSSSAQVRARFNPNATIESSNGGRTFSGLTFSGVGGAVAGCTNLGGKIGGGINSIANIFKSSPRPTTVTAPAPLSGAQNNANAISAANNAPPSFVPPSSPPALSNTTSAIGSSIGSATSQQVPVVSQKTDEELKKANQRESCLNGVAYAVAKGLLRQITDKTLNWVNTGLNGNPLYVRDMNSYLRTISNERISLFLDRIPTQDPIFGTAIRSIATQQLSGIQDGLISKVMDTPEAVAYQDFQDDFTNGGWEAFLNPKNNAIGAIFDAADNLAVDIDQQQQNTRDQLQANNGFLNLDRCVEYADENQPRYPYTYKQYSCPRDIQKEWDTYYATCVRNTGNSAQATCRLSANQIYDPAAITSCISPVRAAATANNPRQCVRYETVTPGSIIQAQVAEVTTSPVRQLEQADQINEVLGSFFDQLLNRLLSDGLSSVGSPGTELEFAL